MKGKISLHHEQDNQYTITIYTIRFVQEPQGQYKTEFTGTLKTGTGSTLPDPTDRYEKLDELLDRMLDIIEKYENGRGEKIGVYQFGKSDDISKKETMEYHITIDKDSHGYFAKVNEDNLPDNSKSLPYPTLDDLLVEIKNTIMKK